MCNVFRLVRHEGLVLCVAVCVLSGCVSRLPFGWRTLPSVPAWETSADGTSEVNVERNLVSAEIGLNYVLRPEGGYVQVSAPCRVGPSAARPLVFGLRADVDANPQLEVKFENRDGTVFGCRVPLSGRSLDWSDIVLYRNNFEYWWGGKGTPECRPDRMYFAVSGKGSGTVQLRGLRFGAPGTTASLPPVGPQLDPDRNLPGIGFRQRRAEAIEKTDSRILEWLKVEQDVSSPEGQLVRTMEENLSHTFNNALVAMAFLVEGEQARAERILDFYAAATDRNCSVPDRQNFFLNGEARGFFQAVYLRPEGEKGAYHAPWGTDRWIGDMAWLLLAYKYYEQKHGADRYREISGLLEELLVSFYTDAPDGPGGYVQHGWRKGDVRLHESGGHPEGNIDCYAAFLACGRPELARQIRIWLDRTLKGTDLPLDLYSWRILAYGRDARRLLDIPEHDLRYRKTLTVNGRRVAGFFDRPAADVQNAWLDGVGHMACAYTTLGDKQRGYFYTNQMDAFRKEKVIGGKRVDVMPYVANSTGGYKWVKLENGFVSVGAWYLFARNGFNPFRLEQVRVNTR